MTERIRNSKRSLYEFFELRPITGGVAVYGIVDDGQSPDVALTILPTERKAREWLEKIYGREVLQNVDCDDERAGRCLDLAREHYQTNVVEIDDDTCFSEGEDGIWVRAWVLVTNAHLGED